jgi:hypothetical protein
MLQHYITQVELSKTNASREIQVVIYITDRVHERQITYAEQQWWPASGHHSTGNMTSLVRSGGSVHGGL